jgi:DNA-binding response OmpR family regulator
MIKEKQHILLIEDNPGDILLTTEILEENKFPFHLEVIRDGHEAIHFFESINKKDFWPDFVLLDINLPKKSGHDVLQYIKKSEKLRSVPVIMLTSSSSERDILASYKYYADGYLVKPVDYTELMIAFDKIIAQR